MTAAPRVALSQDFLLGLSKLPSAIHARVVRWALKFQQNPTSPGINYEKIKAARDPNLRSVRIDQDWRGIVFKPSAGDLYILLHVDHHDEAYRWAERRKMAVNPATGALQIISLEAVESPDTTLDVERAEAQPNAPISPPRAPMFGAVSDEALIQLGTPPDLVPMVRQIASERELDSRQGLLPVEAYEGLFLVAAGDTVSQILSERETRVDRQVDPSDYVAALETAESQSRFVVVTSDNEMTAILNAPLAQWRVFLHPVQRKLAAGDRSGPVRILGGAGTGKTVLALHRAKWLAKNRIEAGERLLFTTFTRNLALDVEQNLKSLFLEDPDLEKIEVCNLDRWVHRYLRKHNYPHRLIYGFDENAWGRAMQLADASLDLDASFYIEEWQHIVSAQGIHSLDEYRRISRVGRKSVLNRSKRDKIWPVFEEYRAQLSSLGLKDIDDAYSDAADLLSQVGAVPPFASIVVDETQDFGPQALRLIRAMVPPGKNDLFFVGDGHQRIYAKHHAVLGRCGIDIRGRSRKLYLNYRTTDEIRKIAVALLEGRDIDDLDGGSDDNRRYKSLSHGPVPEVIERSDSGSGMAVIVDRVAGWMATNETEQPPSVCVMARSKAERDEIAKRLAAHDMTTSIIDADTVDSASSNAVRVATMHRAKGLEFDRVAVFAPDMLDDRNDEAAKLVYVALTRAKAVALLVR